MVITCTVGMGMGMGKIFVGMGRNYWNEVGWGKIYRTGVGRGKIHGNVGRGRFVLPRHSLQPVASNCCNFLVECVKWSQTEVCIICGSKSTDL